MYTAVSFRALIIDPTLQSIQLYSKAASDLLLGTALQESGGFKWSTQRARGGGSGPARGYFQMEGATHDDIWTNYLKFRRHLGDKVKGTLGSGEPRTADVMLTNHSYATAMARIKYKRVSAPIPSSGDINALAKYWKMHYNTALGAGTTEEFIENWIRYTK